MNYLCILSSVTGSGHIKYMATPFLLLYDHLARFKQLTCHVSLDFHNGCVEILEIEEDECCMVSPQCYLLSSHVFYMPKSFSCILQCHSL